MVPPAGGGAIPVRPAPFPDTPPLAPVPPQAPPIPPAAGQAGNARPAPNGGFMDTARSYVGTLGTNVIGGALGTPSALAHAADWAGHKVGVDLGLQNGLHSIRDPSSPNQPLFPTPAEAHEMAYNTTGVTEYVPETRTGRVVQTGLEGVLGGGVGSLATAPVRLGIRMTLSGTVRGAVGAASVGGVGGASGQTAYEAAPDGYKEGAAVLGGLVGGGLAAGRGAVVRRLSPGGRGSPSLSVRPPEQAPVVPDAVPLPPPMTMEGTANPRPPPAGTTAAYGPATGNVPQVAVTGTTRLDLSGRPPVRPQESPRLALPSEPPPPPTPPTAEQQVQALPGHGHGRHGTQTTLPQQEHRLRTGNTPDGDYLPTSTATRFSSPEAELDAVTRAAQRVRARDAAGMLPHTMPGPPPDSLRQMRLARTDIVVTGFPGGYGSGLRRSGKGANMTITPTGQFPNAVVVFDRDPLKGEWKPVSQYPTDRAVTSP